MDFSVNEAIVLSIVVWPIFILLGVLIFTLYKFKNNEVANEQLQLELKTELEATETGRSKSWFQQNWIVLIIIFISLSIYVLLSQTWL